MKLAPCLSCRRHVNVAQATCPFCGAAGSEAPREPSWGRKTRRATAALASLALVGCSDGDGTTTGPGTDAIVDTATADVAVDSGKTEGGADTTVADTTVADAPADGGAEVATDAKPDGNTEGGADSGLADTALLDTGFFPPYGHPPWDENVV